MTLWSRWLSTLGAALQVPSVRASQLASRRGALAGGHWACRATWWPRGSSSAARRDSEAKTERREKVRAIDLAGFPPSRIRNFSVIAHIDHGKTTLSNKLLTLTGTISADTDENRPLDKLQVERERGITVKAHATSMFYELNGEKYLLNLIDTPGHVDFSYEVSRSLAACQGALLVVDASQGVQAQTVANFFLAFDAGLTVIPVMNKLDLATAQKEKVLSELNAAFGFETKDVLLASAKTGMGIDEILPAVIARIPSPQGNPGGPLRVLLVDSWYDRFRGVIALVEVVDGVIRKGDRIKSAHTQLDYEVAELGLLYPDPTPTTALFTGQVGYLISGMRSTREARCGDTLLAVPSRHAARVPDPQPLPGFKPVKSMLYAGLFPVDADDLNKLQDAIQKLVLNDSSVSVEKESSDALGVGFRLGFLGLLHMDVFVQRLEQEFGVNVLSTAPTVPYKVVRTDGTEQLVTTPSQFPDSGEKCETFEPMVIATIIAPNEYLGAIMKLCQEKRGEQLQFTSVDDARMILKYKLPFGEILFQFYDRLKEITSGFATFDYEEHGYEESTICKLSILLNGQPCDPLSMLVHRSRAEYYGRLLTSKLKTLIDKHLFTVAIQAVVGNKIIAREDVSARRKDVTAKCYGGDITRKRKLLEKQKEGKRKMRQIGNVEVSQEAFLAVLSSKG